MPSRKKRMRRKKRSGAVLISLILALLLLILVVALVFIGSDPLGRREKTKGTPAYNITYVDQGTTPEPLVLGVTATPTAAPYAPQTPPPEESGAVAAGEGGSLMPEPLPYAYFLPICTHANRGANDALLISVTIEDCDNAERMNDIVALARRYGAKLTLFPTGDALMNEQMTKAFRSCVKSLGYEIDNKGYTKRAEHSLQSGELAIKMWKLQMAVSYAMGGDCVQNFYRPASLNNLKDQRTHYYAGILGVRAIAGYSYSYEDMQEENLSKLLFNGGIYKFDMSETSFEMLKMLLEAANMKGYKVVTLSELFELPANRMSDKLTIDTQELPEIDGYKPSYCDLSLNDRAYAVITLQARLIQLGYLRGDEMRADGIYGPDTSIAISAFQAKVGLPATGDASVETQEKLFAADAPAFSA